MPEPTNTPPAAIRRNSEGQTVAESFRATAERLERAAHVNAGLEKEQRRQAAAYREMADRWERDNGIA